MPHRQLNQSDLTLISEEEKLYRGIYEKILHEMRQKSKELDHDEKLSRELTAEVVKTRRDEEKQFLQSDESVAHGLLKLRLDQTRALSDLAKQPYFARVIYHEKNRDTEFKLGVASFPELRIIDWRKAPISQLYYDHDEGDSYHDDIAGVEREGQIKLKRAYHGERDVLSNIELKTTSYQKYKGHWYKEKKTFQESFSLRDKEKIKEFLVGANHYSPLPTWQEKEHGYLIHILSLLSPDQFRLISSDLAHPMIVQGSAGTGKTTVALHRLAWLLFENNSNAREENCLVIMPNPILVEYVKKLLPSLGVHGVKIATYKDWKKTPKKYPHRLDHLVIDEAQDFQISQMKELVDCLHDKNQLTIAGDFGQKIVGDDLFTWEALLDRLDISKSGVISLDVAYRSTYQIYELAEHIRDPQVKNEDLKLHPHFGPEPHLTICHNFNEAVQLVKTWIEDVITINQKTIGAIVCKTPNEARKLFEALLKEKVHGIRYGDVTHFEFTPGITITAIERVKGLEFQAMLIFNPSDKEFSDSSLKDRNLLYVAITRAIHKLDLIVCEKPSALIPHFLRTVDLIEIEERAELRRKKSEEEKDVYDLVIEEDKFENRTDKEDDIDPDDELGIFDKPEEKH